MNAQHSISNGLLNVFVKTFGLTYELVGPSQVKVKSGDSEKEVVLNVEFQKINSARNSVIQHMMSPDLASGPILVPLASKRKVGRPAHGDHPEKLRTLRATGKSGDSILLDVPPGKGLRNYEQNVRRMAEKVIGQKKFKMSIKRDVNKVLVTLK